jgi:hypothetical protein
MQVCILLLKQTPQEDQNNKHTFAPFRLLMPGKQLIIQRYYTSFCEVKEFIFLCNHDTVH